MGEPKQLLPVGGRPLLEMVVAEASASSLDEVVVVLGANAERIRGEVDWGRARVVVNPDHAVGMSTSLRAGIAALGPDVDRAVIMLGDQPALTATLLEELLRVHTDSGLPAAAFGFNGITHPPVVLARELWGELEALKGDVGFRAVLRNRPERVAVLPLPGDRDQPIDVDTPEDYRRLLGTETG
jgi:CTP:molybdopterin cytidylyltransferase MocA